MDSKNHFQWVLRLMLIHITFTWGAIFAVGLDYTLSFAIFIPPAILLNDTLHKLESNTTNEIP
jgi:hypothetical protein